MNGAQAKDLLKMTAHTRAAISEEAYQKHLALDARSAAAMLKWAQEEFTADSLFNAGVLEDFLPYLVVQPNARNVRVLKEMSEHIQLVLETEAQRYDPSAFVDYIVKKCLTFEDPLSALEFLEKFALHVKQGDIVFTTNNRLIPNWHVAKVKDGFKVRRRYQTTHASVNFTTLADAVGFVAAE